MHNAAFAELGLDWRYLQLPVPPELFAETVTGAAGLGLRRRERDDPAQGRRARRWPTATRPRAAIGAANTLTFAAARIEADNTDAGGFLDALGEPPARLRALVLGAGGAARAVAWALREAGAAEVAVWNRTPERAAALARRPRGVRQWSGPSAPTCS